MKNIIKYISETIRPPLLLLLSFCLANNASAQNGTALNAVLEKMAKPGSTREWVSFLPGNTLNPRTIFIEYKNAFDLSKDDEMVVRKINHDDIGFTHFRYDQTYKNHRVMYGEYIVHQQPDGIVKSANGRLITGINATGNAAVNEGQALDAALRFMHADKYLWQNAEMEKELKRQEENPQATYYPKGELVYAPGKNKNSFNATDYRLAWSFKVYTDDQKVLAKQVYVDALTANILYAVDIAMVCSGGTGTSAFNGSVSFNTELSGGVYRSHNDCQATDIYVYKCNRGGASNTYYTDADNSWTQQSAVQAQWGAKMTYDYYFGDHGRQSWNGSAGDMIAYNNADIPDLGVNNACWGCAGNNTIFGAGSTTAATDDWNTNDIMGHEFTHGVTQDEAGLEYQNESGALNESFSDIFGEMVESWSESNCDYLVGGDRGAIRNMSDPNDYNDPDTYLGTNWYTGTGDNGGVHTNSGVQNYWFYLVSEGGSGTNDLGKSFNVAAITRFKARLIAYRSLTQYLTSSSQYIDARKGSLEAALDLYGQCSSEIIAVGDAWHAVGVESQSSAYTENACGLYTNGEFVQAISTLTAASGCATLVTSSASIVYFAARDKVVLYPGFRAQSGSRFKAYLEPCSSTRWKTAPKETLSEAEKNGTVNANKVSSAAATANKPKSDEIVSVMPNPFTNSFSVSINAGKAARVDISVYNTLGAKVQQQQGINLIKGNNNILFNVAGFASGTYMLEVNFGDFKIVKKMVKN